MKDDLDDFDVDDHIGHYVSHIFRNNKRWERFDEMHSKINTSDTSGMPEVRVLFYVSFWILYTSVCNNFLGTPIETVCIFIEIKM